MKVTGNVIFTDHAFDRMEERSVVSRLGQEDAYWILETGMATSAPRRDGDAWIVTIARRMPGTREAGVVTAVAKDNDKLIVVTVEWMDWL